MQASTVKPPVSGEPDIDDGRPYDERQTSRAWEEFATSDRRSPSRAHVRGVIERSWQRSAASGVDMRGNGSTLIVSQDDLYDLRNKNDDLLVSTAQTFRSIAEILGDTTTMAVITDQNGVVLDVAGDPRTIDAGHEIRLEVGAAWAETVTGTNGIGTALITGQPVHVHAAEHFAEGVRAWTCFGAPIRSPLDGSIVGIIDFSGPQDIFHRHNVALAVMAAKHIELALSEKLRIDQMRLLEASLGRMRGLGSSDGIVIVDRFGRIIHHNDIASVRWRDLSPPIELRVGAKIMSVGDRSMFGSELPDDLRGQNLEPLVVDGKVKGALLILAAATKAGVNSRRVAAPPSPAAEAVKATIVGNSDSLLQALARVERAAQGKSAILLEGETGVGKELFARLAHAVGRHTGKEPFVVFNCGAVSKDLIGAELFGYAPGAFTGATKDGRPGRFELAHGGVLSLDEIGELPLDLQPYLLRVLEEHVAYRLGDSKPRPVDVRLVASTNRNLKQEVAEGRFRKDLYFRISAVKIAIPPLRERGGDTEILIEHFNRKFSSTYGTEPLSFNDEALCILRQYDWPGNVRELRNLVENLVLMSTNRRIGPTDLPEDFAVAPTDRARPALASPPVSFISADDISSLDETERRVIEQAIAAANGNISLAAEKLGVSRSTLYRRLQRYRSKH